MTESRDPAATDGRLAEETAAEVVELVHLRELAARLQDENRHLTTALESRVVIEQAKGVLAERLKMTVDEAFTLLRRGARSGRVELRELAALVVSSPTTPPEVERAARAPSQDKPA
jgi:AmiR/NasT family two-component response regulator